MQVLQQTDDMLLGPKRSRAVARLLLVFVTTLCSLGLVTALAAVFEHLARTPQAIASSTGQISVTGYPITTVPVGALPSLPAATATQRLLMHGQAQVSNGLVLVPGVLPSQGSTGELYYDQGTNRPYFYNGSSFISLQSTAGTQPSVMNQTFVTNTTSPTTVVEQINNGAALSGLTTDGVVYATSATTVSTLPLMADGVLVTNASSQPVLSQILPTTIQNNITSTGVLTSGSIASGFGAINTNSSIATSTMLQGGTIIVGADGSSQPASVTIRGGAATGTDATGASTVFDAGNGTGNGGSGDLIFRTASSNVLPVTLGDTAESEAYTQSSMSTTFNVTSHANMVMVVGVNQQDNTQSVSSVAWNGSTAGWTRIGSQASAGGVVELWYLVNPVSGSHTLTINFSATSGNNHQFVGAETFYNVSQTAPIAASNTGAGTTAGTTSVAVATSSGQVAVDVIGDNQFCLGAPGAGQTRTWADQLGPNTILGGSYKTTNAGSTAMSWGVTSSCTWESVVAAISPVPGSVSDTLTDRLHVTATGNVGINTSSPQYTLDIAGAARIQTPTNSTTAFQIQNASGTALLVADTTNMQVRVTSLVVSTALTVDGHIVTGGTTPGIAAGAAACTTPTVSIAGNDTAGRITVTTGSGCVAAGTLATVTFNVAYTSSPYVQLTPDSATAAGLVPYKTSTATNFTVSTSNIPANTTTYAFDYLVVQ